MELDKVLKDRRTIRKYFNKEVSWMLVSEVLNAGRLAPSSGNIQNWIFIVLKKKEEREKAVKYCDNGSWIANAPVLILVCADIEKAKRMFGSRGELYSIQNCSCAVMQMMLKAHELGLGSCWIGSFDESGIARAFEIEKGFRVLTILSIGYGEPDHELEREELTNKVYFGKFGEKERKKEFTMLPLEIPIKRNVEHLKIKLNSAFDEGTSEHRKKVKEFLGRFGKKK